MAGNDPVAVVGQRSDESLMRCLVRGILALSLFGCSEQIDETYATYADAERAGAIERGWLPAFVPRSARNLEETHDLDTSRQTLSFTIPASDAASMAARFRTTSAEDSDAAAKLIDQHGFNAASKVFVVCAKPLSGALAVDAKSDRAVFTTTIDWVDDDCQ